MRAALRRMLVSIIVPDDAENLNADDSEVGDLTPGQQWLLATLRRRRWSAAIVDRIEADSYLCGWNDCSTEAEEATLDEDAGE